MPLIDCPSDGSAIKRERIKELLSEGYTKNEIKKIFVKDYGPEVLVKPPFSGFSLMAWIFPFVALAGAGLFVKKYLQDKVVADNAGNNNTGKQLKNGQKPHETAINGEDEEKVRAEMKKYL